MRSLSVRLKTLESLVICDYRAGGWDHGRNTATDRGRRNAAIDFGRRTNHTFGPRQLIAQIGAAGCFSLRRHGPRRRFSPRNLVAPVIENDGNL
jgi:hypothetical protein